MSRYPEVYVGADGHPYREPAYRLTGPVQLDDIWFGEGEEVIFPGIPNEFMQPLNAAAERNYIDWLTSLPDKGLSRSDDLMQAAWEMRPKEGEDTRSFKEYQVAVFKRALEIKTGAAARPKDTLEPKAYRPTENVPPMSNVNLSSGSGLVPPPQNVKPRTSKTLPQSQRPRRETAPMGNTPVAEPHLPTS